MKTIAIWSGVAAFAFVIVSTQMGLFQPRRDRDESAQVEQAVAVPAKAGTVFPDDLAPAAQARPVPLAAAYQPGPGIHPLVFLRLNGWLHAWQETLREDWAADSVGATELAVIVGVPRKTFVSAHHYPNKAPTITRYMYELEISVIEAKTGKILANRLFRNVPRPLRYMESWETTLIGRAVTQQQIFGWVSRMSKQGFPDAHDTEPIVTQMD
jgi:hypothetical protein